MAVYKRKGSDIYYMDFNRYGRRIFRSTGKTNKEEAQEVERQVRSQFDESLSGKHLLSEAVVAVFNRKEQRDDTARLLLKYIGERPVDEIGEKDIERLIRKLRRRGATEPATLNRYMSALRIILKVAKEYWELESIPKIPSFKVDTNTRVLTVNEETGLIKHFKSEDNRTMKDLVIVLLSTGLKLSEALRLTIYSIDESTMSIHVGTGKGERSVPIDETVKSIFLKKRYVKRDNRIFKIDPAEVEYEWSKARKALGLEKDKGFNIGGLRHTYAVGQLKRGGTLETVAQLLGCALATVAKRYKSFVSCNEK
jgi:integrase/recombinase XerD